MRTSRPSHRRTIATIATLAASPLVLGLAVNTATPAIAAEELPAPEILYTFDGNASASTIENEGTLGADFDARVRNASALARGTGPTEDLGASGLLPGGPRNSPADAAPYLDVPPGLFDGTDAMTVSTWIKWDGRNADQLPWSYIIGSDALPNNNWGLYFVPNEGGRSKAVGNSGTEVKAVAPSALAANTWAQITTVADGTSLSYYLNGELVATEPIALDFALLGESDSTRSGLIGRVPWASQYAALFGGEFDDFAVYKTALSAGQVAQAFVDDVGTIVSVDPQTFDVATPAGLAPTLPATTKATRAGGSVTEAAIAWEYVTPADYAEAGSTFAVTGTVAGWDGTLTATVQVTARATEAVTVDFAQRTGAFRGGASGTLYGLGDEGSPTQALVNGSSMTNISQKPPFGTQHPGGDALNVEDTFFDKHGEDLYVYTQDYYPDWPYNGARRPGDDLTYTRDASGVLTGESTAGGNGLWDYLEILEIVVDGIANDAKNPEKFVFIPFNEVDLQWLNSDDLYNRFMHVGNQPDSFTPDGATDWAAAWKVITDTYARHGLDRPRIAGPGDSRWRGEANIEAFLNMAVATDTIPDVYVWHELGGYQWMPQRVDAFRSYARQLDIAEDDIPEVNITEWGASSDMSSPANLLRWFASFEAAKVDAQTAYWTASGTMSDNQAKVNSANGGWWLFNWYGNLAGSDTARVTANQEKAIAGIDDANRRAQVVVGGLRDGRDGALSVRGLSAETFGSAVDVEVREVLVNGTDGVGGTPRLVVAQDEVAVQNGRVDLRIPSRNASSVYQVIMTPASERDVESDAAAQPERHTAEAESLALTDAQVRQPGGYRASGDQDVSGFSSVGSRAAWEVDIAEAGLYRLQVLGATPGVQAQHALFVDDESSQTIQYGVNAIKPSNVRTVARGTASAYVPLAAGEHRLELRASGNGTDLLPGAGVDGGVTLDRLELVRVGNEVNSESVTHPASTYRLYDGARLDDGAAVLDEGGRADLYPSTVESGYYDVAVDWAGAGDSELELTVNGRVAAVLQGGDDSDSSVRVHLPEGITELELRSSGEATVRSVSVTRAVEGDASIVRIEAEDASRIALGGTAAVSGFGGVLTNGTGSGFVQGLGITDADPSNEGTFTVERGDELAEAGAYNVVVHFSNDDIEGTHDYNPQVVDLGLQATEAGVAPLAGRTTFRYTYAVTNFWEAVMPLDLTTETGAITFGNTRSTLYIDEGPTGGTSDDEVLEGYAVAPDVDWIAFAPFVLDGDDAIDPTVVPTVTADVPGEAGWLRSAATVSLELGQGSGDIQYRIDEGPWETYTRPFTVESDGARVVNYRAVQDGVPVASSAGAVPVNVDSVAPVTSVAVTPSGGVATVGQTATATFTAIDSTSGVSRTEYSLDGGDWAAAAAEGVSVTEKGSYVIRYRSVDVAGNVEQTREVVLTVADPATTARVRITSAGKPTEDGWYRQAVLVGLTAPKAGQRVQYSVNDGPWRTYRSAVSVTRDGTTTIAHRVLSDDVVVAGSEAETLVKIDRSAPTMSVSRNPERGVGSPRNPISLSFEGADRVSGIGSLEYRVNRGEWTTVAGDVELVEAGDYVVTYRATDLAGNRSPIESMTVSIVDDPVTSVSGSPSVSAGSALTVRVAGFPRWSDVTLTIGQRVIGQVFTDQNGSARVTVRTPSDLAKGTSVLIATDPTSGLTAERPITVR